MKDFETYSAILEAAIDENPALAEAEAGSVAYTDAADALADSLYRLCIEFGVAFNDFRRVLLEDARSSKTRPAPSDTEGSGAVLATAGQHAELVILALELMREDSSF